MPGFVQGIGQLGRVLVEQALIGRLLIVRPQVAKRLIHSKKGGEKGNIGIHILQHFPPPPTFSGVLRGVSYVCGS